MIDPPEREKLQALLDRLQVAEAAARNGPHSGPYGGAYVVRCSCDPGPNGDGGQTVVDPIRLFSLREDVRWPSGRTTRSCCSTWGAIAVERQDWPRALDYLRRSLAGSAPTDSITRKLFAMISRCHQMLGDLEGAVAVCAEGLSFDPDDAELLFRKAVLHRKASQPAEAEATAKLAG